MKYIISFTIICMLLLNLGCTTKREAYRISESKFNPSDLPVGDFVGHWGDYLKNGQKVSFVTSTSTGTFNVIRSGVENSDDIFTLAISKNMSIDFFVENFFSRYSEIRLVGIDKKFKNLHLGGHDVRREDKDENLWHGFRIIIQKQKIVQISGETEEELSYKSSALRKLPHDKAIELNYVKGSTIQDLFLCLDSLKLSGVKNRVMLRKLKAKGQ